MLEQKTRYYIDLDGNFLGGFCGDTEIDHNNHVEVQSPPDHGLQIYDFENKVWLPLDLTRLG